MGGERRHGAEELLQLLWSQQGHDLVNDLQANSLLPFVPGSEDRERRGAQGNSLVPTLTDTKHVNC